MATASDRRAAAKYTSATSTHFRTNSSGALESRETCKGALNSRSGGRDQPGGSRIRYHASFDKRNCLGELHVRLRRCLVGRNIGGRRLARGPEVAHVAVDRAQIGAAHVVQIEPRHGRTRAQRLRLLDPFLFLEALHVKPQVGRVGGPPGPAPAERVAGEPFGFRRLTAAHRVACSVAVVAAGDADEVAAALHVLALTENRGAGREQYGKKSASHASCLWIAARSHHTCSDVILPAASSKMCSRRKLTLP